MHALYYWKPDNYKRDRRFGFAFHLNQNSPVLAEVASGESVWAFTRNGLGHYVLAAQLVVRAVTRNAPRFRYGRYRVWGDLEASRYFETELAPRAESLIRSLDVTARAERLGQSFQGRSAVKPLREADARLLAMFSADLELIEPAGIFAEDEFEARLAVGAQARGMLVRETDARQSSRMRYLYETVDITRSRRHVELLQREYQGRCQICAFDPRKCYGHRLCHGHHIQWLSRGGQDALDNMVLVCPNHHAAIHADDAPFDYGTLSFAFSTGQTGELKLNSHLPRAG